MESVAYVRVGANSLQQFSRVFLGTVSHCCRVGYRAAVAHDGHAAGCSQLTKQSGPSVHAYGEKVPIRDVCRMELLQPGASLTHNAEEPRGRWSLSGSARNVSLLCWGSVSVYFCTSIQVSGHAE